MTGLDRVAVAVRALADGHGVVVADASDREDEGDVIFTAESVTESQIAFLMSEARGLICVAMTGADLDRLELPLMVERNEDQHRTAFTVSVDARSDVTTGISAADRALTSRLLASPTTRRRDLVVPGHLFPLRSSDQGVVVRTGHTEAAVDLLRLAGRRPCGVICEVADAAGRMVRGQALEVFAQSHGLPYVSIAEIVSFVQRQAGSTDALYDR